MCRRQLGPVRSVCTDLRLTNQQAQEFFAKAERITQKQLHDDYVYLPCWVEGTMTTGAERSSC